MTQKIFTFIAVFILTATNIFAQNNNSFPLTRAIWHTNKISVCWDNPTEQNKARRELVREAITETWQKYSALEFTDWCSSKEKDCDIHIYINDEGPHTKGLGTMLRNVPKGMVLNFTFNNWSQSCKGDKEFCIKAIAVHEFGHALGFAHEQNRKDCKFPNCLGEEQGQDGDWYMTPCDLNSIMNYCSPKWNNNGLLSELDIKAIQKLYGLPSNQQNEYKGLQIVHNTEYAGKRRKTNWYNIKVYVSGNKEDLDKVSKVSYKLHETFKNPIMTNDFRNSNFGIGLKVWGEFEIIATIEYKDGTKKEITHYLSIDKV
jgi:hypothetical protein